MKEPKPICTLFSSLPSASTLVILQKSVWLVCCSYVAFPVPSSAITWVNSCILPSPYCSTEGHHCRAHDQGIGRDVASLAVECKSKLLKKLPQEGFISPLFVYSTIYLYTCTFVDY